jgi:peptidoglycan/xylan/chitin deacetylase (PgdA/CDA1 family)
MTLRRFLASLGSASMGHACTGVIINEHTLDAAQTRRHVEVLGRWFEFVHHDDLLARARRPRGRPFCLLTFDDGKRSGYSETAPQLERLGVPAVFYVTTGFIGSNTPLWFDCYEALCAAAVPLPAGLEPAIVKQLPLELLEDRLQRACAEYKVAIDMQDDRYRPMNWREVSHLARRGFTVGAHGVRHTVLTREREADAMREVEQSMTDVTAHTGVPCATFAFPNGNYTARLARQAARCGARTVMTTEPTWVQSRSVSWRLPRIQLFEGQSDIKLQLKLAVAATGRLLANPDGTGRLYRRIDRLQRASATSGSSTPDRLTAYGPEVERHV